MLGQVGKNSAEEFFETIIYHVAYDEAQKVLHEYTKDIENPVLRDAVDSALSVALFGAVFYVIQKQEKLIELVFATAGTICMHLFAKAKGAFSKIKGTRGVKATRRFRFLSEQNNDDLLIAQTIATYSGHMGGAQAFFQPKSSSNSSDRSIETYRAYNDTKQSVYKREELHMNLGNNVASRYNETLLFKLFTKSFTPNDELLMKKILGRDTSAALNMSDLNQVADFLFVKDTSGKITGLSEAFFQLVNTMGYINK